MSPTAATAAQIRAGLRDAAPVGLGLVPLGSAFGLLVTQAGYPWWWAPVFSVVVYAGSMEFLALGLVAGGVGLVQAAVTAFLVNFRHIFYGLSFPLHKVRSWVGRAYSVYALTDESYAVAVTRDLEDAGEARILTIQGVCQALWVVPGIVGAWVGATLPITLPGLEFALTALFVVLAMDALRVHGDYGAALLAAACGLGALLLAPGQLLVGALAAFVALLTVRFVVRRKEGL